MSFGVNIFEFLEDENDPEKTTKKLAPKEKVGTQEKPAPSKPQNETKKNDRANENNQVTTNGRGRGKESKGETRQARSEPKVPRQDKPAEVQDQHGQFEDASDTNNNNNRSRNSRSRGPRSDKPNDRPRNFTSSGGGSSGGGGNSGEARDEGRSDARDTSRIDSRGPKRQFDRRSGSGRGKEVKKGGSGKGNWGSWQESPEQVTTEEGRKVEVKASEVQHSEAEEAAPTSEGPEKEAEAKEEKPEEKEPEIIQKSLDEYLNEMKSKEPNISLPQTRAPGEGVDSSQWNAYVPLKRADDNENAPAKVKKNAKPAVETKKQVLASEVLKFQEPRRPRRDDRGSGEYSDQRKKGFGGRSNNNNSPKRGSNKSAPNFSADSFPSLPAAKA